MNIVLTGLRGSGKSKLGKILAEKINFTFVDLDQMIEEHEGKTISEIVERRGWEYFRAVESKICTEASKLDKTVIATGGGAIIDPDNEKALKKNGKIIYLFVKPEICASRIMNSENRPPLTNEESVLEELKQLYKTRNHRYCESAHRVFERSDDPDKDAEEIIKMLTTTYSLQL